MQPTDKNGINIPVAVQETRQELFSGPVPPPAVLQGYRDVDPSYPERIIRMAEKHADADVLRKVKDAHSIILGQVLSFLICAIGFGVCVYLAKLGLQGGAIAAAIGGIVPIVVSALSNLRR